MSRHQIFMLFLIGFAAFQSKAAPIPSGKYLSSIPASPVIVKQVAGHWLVSFCPDNTCDIIRISTSVKENDARRLALGYFVFYSRYIYLDEWQQDARSNKEIQAELRYLANRACPPRPGKELVRCRFEELESTGKLAVLFGRSDEGKWRAAPLSLKDVFGNP